MNAPQKRESKEPLKIPLKFEDALEALLQIKPIENGDLKPKRPGASKAKKKSKPKK